MKISVFVACSLVLTACGSDPGHPPFLDDQTVNGVSVGAAGQSPQPDSGSTPETNVAVGSAGAGGTPVSGSGGTAQVVAQGGAGGQQQVTEPDAGTQVQPPDSGQAPTSEASTDAATPDVEAPTTEDDCSHPKCCYVGTAAEKGDKCPGVALVVCPARTVPNHLKWANCNDQAGNTCCNPVNPSICGSFQCP